MYTETLLLTTHFQFKLMEHLTWWGLLIISTHFSSQSVGRWKIFDLIWANFGVPWWGIWPKILLKSQMPQICLGSPLGSTLLLILLAQHICLGLAIMIAFISKCYKTPLKAALFTNYLFNKHNYVICRLGGPYGEKLWPRAWGSRSQFFTIWKDLKPANNMFIFFLQ